jgi:hypothetical protein
MSSLAKAIDNDELQLTADFFSCLFKEGGLRERMTRTRLAERAKTAGRRTGEKER